MINRIIYIMGVSGSGKTTVGNLLAQKIHLPFFDADDLHPQANREKMRSGQALNDEDRKEWLQNIHELAVEQVQLNGAVIACSALKERYRSVLNDSIEHPLWIFLQGSYEMIFERMNNRQGHYMPASLLRSQFDNLEIPNDAVTISIEKTPEEIVELIMASNFLQVENPELKNRNTPPAAKN
jgi:carbohydrate kinase (thermoresistant glucokinase family)